MSRTWMVGGLAVAAVGMMMACAAHPAGHSQDLLAKAQFEFAAKARDTMFKRGVVQGSAPEATETPQPLERPAEESAQLSEPPIALSFPPTAQTSPAAPTPEPTVLAAREEHLVEAIENAPDAKPFDAAQVSAPRPSQAEPISNTPVTLRPTDKVAIEKDVTNRPKSIVHRKSYPVPAPSAAARARRHPNRNAPGDDVSRALKALRAHGIEIAAMIGRSM